MFESMMEKIKGIKVDDLGDRICGSLSPGQLLLVQC